MKQRTHQMHWFRENRFLGTFVAIFGVCLLASLWFFVSAKSDYDQATTRFRNVRTELDRLEKGSPYPTDENLRKMKALSEEYAVAFAKLKAELRKRATPVPEIKPHEFQSRLRVAMNAVADKGRANKVKLPERFYLGFEEFASALPDESVAPRFGQDLAQIEWLVNGLLDARVDSLNFFRRAPSREADAKLPSPPAPAGGGAKPAPPASSLLEKNIVELSFVASPSTARKVVNQIAGAAEQFCIIRLLHVRNERDKGPAREVGPDTGGASVPAVSPKTKAAPGLALDFIVGTEKIETTARIEMVRFAL
jgi:hypothetical protein